MKNPRVAIAAFSLLVALSIIAKWSLLVAYVAFARLDESSSHIVIVPLITVFLVVQQRREIFQAISIDWAGFPIALVGAAASWLTHVVDAPVANAGLWLSMSIAALVTLWLGTFIFCFGRQAFREALFPMLFLVLMIPLPPEVLEATVHVLKAGSAEAVAMLFWVTGTPFHREGYVFSLPRFAIEIADECSGIRSSIALFLTALLFGNAFLSNRWSKIALVLSVLPLAVLKNGVRIAGLSLLATHVDEGFLTGQLHHEGGVVFFVISVALLAGVLNVVRRTERRIAS